MIKEILPMYNTEDIYSRLLAGENSEVIAQEFADALNAAQAKMAEEAARKAEEEAKVAMEKAAAEEKKKLKREILAELIAEAFVFISEYYPSFGITPAEVDELDDETLYALADMFIVLLDLEALKPSKRTLKFKGKDLFNKPTAEQKIEDPFAAFFKEMGL
jgi:hypothetical protein